MKIVGFDEFYKLPSGTVYAHYEPCILRGLFIKGDSIRGGADFFYVSLLDTIDANSSEETFDLLDKAEKEKISIDLDFDSEERDGVFDYDRLFAIWEERDVFGLVKKITTMVADVERLSS